MKRFDRSYARFLLDSHDNERLLRYCRSALEEGFTEAASFIETCNRTSVSKESDDLPSHIRYFIDCEDKSEEVSLKDFVKFIKHRSNQGIPAAQYALSEFYFNGNGVRKNVQKAYELMEAAADSGFAKAQLIMAYAYLKGVFYNLKPDIAKGIDYLTNAADQKLPEALNLLGYYHLKGLSGVEKSTKKAFALISEAAESENAESLYLLSEFHRHGLGTRKSMKKAVYYCKSAAEKEFPAAQYAMWQYYLTGNAKICYDKAFAYLCASSDSGFPETVNALGEVFYDDGEIDDAFRHFEIASAKGCVDAIYNLAECYYLGMGTDQNYKIAFELYSRIAEHKHPEAIYSLAWCYDYGQGTKKNKKLAFEWYMEAAKLGHPSATNNLGVCYATGKGTRKNIKKAFACYTVAARYNIKEAINSLGSFYETGSGTEKDLEKAVEMYQRAGLLGDCTAKYNLARCYEYGKGVKKDVSKAVDLYIQSAAQDEPEYLDKLYKLKINKLSHSDAFKISKKLFNTDKSEYRKRALELLIYSAESGNADFQRDLGVRLWNDMQMYSLAFIYFKKSAEQGDPYSIYNLANNYYNGYGITQNYEKAWELYNSAAEQDLPYALSELGLAYETGFHDIVDKDLEKAIEYYKKGSDLGNSDCKNNLGAMYMKGKGLRKNQKRGFKLFSEAAECNKYAKSNLAMCYQFASGTQKDLQKAIQLYSKLASDGDSFAVERLEKLSDEIKDSSHFFVLGLCYDTGKGVPCDKEKAIKYYTLAADMGHKRARQELERNLKGKATLLQGDETPDQLKKTAEKGNADAMYYLGLCYEEGRHNTEINPSLAIKWYYESAEKGYEPAIEKLKNSDLLSKADPGYIRKITFDYYDDEEQEQKLYEIAAEGGDALAMHNLAYSLEKSDPERAFELYKKSADLKEPYGIYAVAKCYENGLGVVRDNKLYFKYLKKAAELGIADAITDLGACYGNGIGTAKNTKKALKLYLKAAILGDSLALSNIAWFYETGTDVEKDTDLAYHLYKAAADNGEKHAIERLKDWE